MGPRFPDADSQYTLADDCRRCSELAASRTCLSWGNGPLDARLVVVGEAPAAGDPDADQWRGGNLTRMAYTSRASGRKIRTLLADAGFGHEDCYFTNAVKCHPPGNRDPTDDELANCRPYLVEEVETVAPTAVVTTGKHATETVLAPDGESLAAFSTPFWSRDTATRSTVRSSRSCIRAIRWCGSRGWGTAARSMLRRLRRQSTER